jgi:hypothetical protein
MAYRQTAFTKKESEKEKPAPVTLRERLPSVAGVVFSMTYFQKETADTPLMLRTVNFYPTSEADFNMRCMNRDCLEGGFDLTGAVLGMVRKKKRSARGEMRCSGKNKALPADHASVSFQIAVKYRPAVKKAKSKAAGVRPQPRHARV